MRVRLIAGLANVLAGISQKYSARSKPDEAMVFLILAVWMCTLPPMIIVALSFSGWRWVGFIAGVLLVAKLIACRILYTVNVYRSQKPEVPGGSKYGN